MSLEDVIALYGAGRLSEAENACRALIQDTPDHAPAHNVLGAVLLAGSRVSEAIAAIEEAVRLDPGYAQGHNNLGNALRAAGRLLDAAASFERAVALSPTLQPAHSNLGIVLNELGRLDEAKEALEAAVGLDPLDAEAKVSLAIVLLALGKPRQASEVLRAAVSMAPNLPEAHGNLGNALSELNDIQGALAAYDRAIELRPGSAAAHYNRGKALIRQGRIDDGLDAYERALDLAPGNSETISNLLFALNYSDRLSAREVASRHRELAPPLGATSPPLPTPAKDHRPLRIGYVSPDLRDHSVAYFLLPLLEAHDRTRVRVTCYSASREADHVTARLRAASDVWREIADLSTNALRDLIREDQVDILIDLAGHSGRNRLDAFAVRSAPIQVSWLGYPNTTGLPTMDARLTDAVADPVGDADTFHSERLIRVPAGFLCYRPDAAPDVAAPPCGRNGFITFGSFNNLPKTSPATIKAWASILRSVPGSRLLLKSRHLADASTRARVAKLLVDEGIDVDRLTCRALLPHRADHLALYGEIDIALDPFPYNGTTTTCEALWMGVPVVTARGDRHAGRVGASLLTAIGREEWIAESIDDLVPVARGLAMDQARLAEERKGLRALVEASPLRDETGFARRIETIYEDLAGSSSSSSSVSSPSS